MIWKCPYNYQCDTCSRHHIDKFIGRDYCLKTGKEINVTRVEYGTVHTKIRCSGGDRKN